MKKLVYIILSLVIVQSCKTASDSFTVEGTVKKMGDGEIYFIAAGDDQKPDTVKVKDDHFTYTGKVKEPTVYMVNFGANQQPGFLIVENGKSTLQYEMDAMNSLEVKGGKEQAIYSAFLNECKPVFKQMDSLGQIASQNEENTNVLSDLQTKFSSLDELLKKKQRDFIQANKTSIATAFIGVNYINEKMDASLEEVESIYNPLDPKVKESYFGKQINKRILQMKGTSIGQAAPAFELNDAKGNLVSLASFKGQYTLIDFWASWCNPCRAENPNVVAAYNKFKSKGFTVVGISLDTQKENWLAAVEKDKLTWTQLSDLKGWSSEVASLYGVQSIPMNFLLDKEGKIVAKDLRGEALVTKLNELTSQ